MDSEECGQVRHVIVKKDKESLIETSKGNPMRWFTPAFPTNGRYIHDEEINWINSLEFNLPEKIPIIESFEEFNRSDNEVAKIRAEIQVATMHCHAAYFDNIEILLNNIGKLRRERGVMWCGFGVFGRDDPAQQDQMPPFPKHLRQRREGTLAMLREWLRKTPVNEARRNSMISGKRVEWIYSALGERCDVKCWLVGCLCEVLKQSLRAHWLKELDVNFSKYSLQSLFRQDKDQTPISDDALILDRIEKGLSLTDDVRAIRRAMEPPRECVCCHFRFNRWVDNLIPAIGQLKFNGGHAPVEPPISVEGWVKRKRQYVRAINAWIDGKTLQESVSQVTASAPIIRRVYLLSEASATKIWLAASLSKTMRSMGDAALSDLRPLRPPRHPLRPRDEVPPQSFNRGS